MKAQDTNPIQEVGGQSHGSLMIIQRKPGVNKGASRKLKVISTIQSNPG